MMYASIEGGAELAAVLRALPEKLAKNALAQVGRAGALELRDAAMTQLSTSMRRGVREDDIIIKRERSRKGDDLQVDFGVGPPINKPWLRWLHEGTKPHLIARVKAVLTDGTRIFGDVIRHPGQPPRPYLKQAQFNSRDRVFRVMALKMKVALAKQVKRLVSQKYRSQQLRRIFS